MIGSFCKEQWLDLLFSAVCFVVAIVLLFIPVEGIIFGFILYLISGLYWLAVAFIHYGYKRIEALAKRVADLEAEAITDIDEESPGYYMVKRRLGPDKEEK